MNDIEIRLKAFEWLKEQVHLHGDTLHRELLRKGFLFNGNRVPLVSPQGIFKPQVCELPLTITTSPGGPYEDSVDDSGLLLYKYRGTNPSHKDNVGLRELMQANTPLIYLIGIMPSIYTAIWPVFIIEDHPSDLSFTVVVDSITHFQTKTNQISDRDAIRREYITSSVKVRLHQSTFREKVLTAYHTQCAMCRLKHKELLDAAHIIPDSDPEGNPVVTNGIALCKLHHAAFDKYFVGITPDFQIVVRHDILVEKDGPMLKFGLQALERKELILPKSKSDWPNRDFLNRRFSEFIG